MSVFSADFLSAELGSIFARMSSRASRPRSASSRSRRQRLAAGAVLATTSLLGTYLAAIRPQPIYAAPNTGSQLSQGRVGPANSGLCAVADDTTVYDDTSLRTAVVESTDGDVICIGASIQLSGPLNIDDTTITLIGDDRSTTLTAATGSRIIYADFYGDIGDDTLTITDLTLTGADDTTTKGGALYAIGEVGDGLVIQRTTFRNNSASNGGALFTYDIALAISYSAFESNRGWRDGDGRGGDGGAIYAKNGNPGFGTTITESTFTDNQSQPPTEATRDSRGGAIYFTRYTTGIRIENSYFAQNSTGSSSDNGNYGGAIYSDAYDPSGAPGLVIVGTTFKENRADRGGAIYAPSRSGLEIEDSVFTNNYAGNNGGAVMSSNHVQVSNSLFEGNDSNGPYGGALYIYNYRNTTRSTITSSSFINNGDDTMADDGGALFKYDGDMLISNSLFQGNKATQNGGGIFISNSGDDDTITYTTIVGNQVSFDGAGLFVAGSSERVVVQNSVLYNNNDIGASPSVFDIQGNNGVTLISSLYTDPTSLSNVTVDPSSTDGNPSLLGATDNGGPSIGFDDTYLPTSVPPATSIAVGRADSNLLPTVSLDQVGATRTGNVAGSMNAASSPTPPTPPTPTFPPSAPLNITGTAGDASATITWTAPASAGSFPITDYQAVLSPGGATCLVQAPALSCTITGLTNGTPYTATARALNGAGWGAFSAPSEPFTPGSSPSTKTIVITGTRGTVKDRPGVYANGETTGLVGATVQARVKLAGELEYRDGSTRIVQPDGSFQWQRKTGKKVYVYFIADDRQVRSNRVIIPAR